jgi:sugar lactone lactonase YvrE
LNDAQQVVWREGRAVPRKRHLSFPRSVQYLGGNRYLIVDTSENRILDYDGGRVSEIRVSGSRGLAWPRAAHRTWRGTLIVADGLNSRVLELTMEGHVLRELHNARYRGKPLFLRDPHDVRELPNGNLLITDAAQNLVLESDWNGEAAWIIWNEDDSTLDDPHSAQLLPDGRIMISDCGHNRIIFADPATGEIHPLTGLVLDGRDIRLTFPRYSDVAENGTLVIADTFNNRVLAVDPGGAVLWVLSEIPDSPIPTMQHPRWAHLIDCNEIVVSDYFNHRILHLRRLVE